MKLFGFGVGHGEEVTNKLAGTLVVQLPYKMTASLHSADAGLH